MKKFFMKLGLFSMAMALEMAVAAAAPTPGVYGDILSHLPSVGSYAADMPGYQQVLMLPGYPPAELKGNFHELSYEVSLAGSGRVTAVTIRPEGALTAPADIEQRVREEMARRYGAVVVKDAAGICYWQGNVTAVYDRTTGQLDIRQAD